MDAFDDDEFGRRARSLRLDTLIRLRWLGIVGQSAAVLVAYLGLGVRFSIFACFGCIAASILLNVWLRARFPVAQRLTDARAAEILGFDIAQLAALLFLTGGLANPFSILFLAPVMTSAASLPWRQTALLLGFTLVCATVLAYWRWPLRGPDGIEFEPPLLYGIGLWAAIGVSAIFVSLYAYRVANEARQLASALTATELMLARAQHLSQLDGLAAAAAHELGTPLATVALVVHEMAAQPAIAQRFGDDLRLVEEQVARCRTILGRLSAPAAMAAAAEETSLGHLIEEIAAPHRLQDVEIEVFLSGDGPEPVCGRNPAMIYGLANLVENAVGFAATRVGIRATWTTAAVSLIVADDGPGFPTPVLDRLGEPYISNDAVARRGEGGAAGGLGLGLFIAKALLERTGATLKIANADPPRRGASALATWPRAAFEKSRAKPEPALAGRAGV